MQSSQSSCSQSVDIYSLPVEVIVLIFHQLDVKTIWNCKRVCRLFRNIDDVSLQYKNELEIAGMLDGPTSELETIDRLKILREHQSAWESLSWTAEETIRQMGGVWELNGGVLGQALSHSSLMFWQLPSRIRGVQSRNWIIQVPDTNIRDFTMDPSYDLLIAVQLAEPCKIHVLSMETGNSHPLALSSSIEASSLSGTRVQSFNIANSYSFVAVMANFVDCTKLLVIYNWRTGQLVKTITKPFLESFSFVTDDLVVVAISGSFPQPSTLQVFDLSSAIGDGVKSGPFSFLLLDSPFETHIHISGGHLHTGMEILSSSSKTPFYTSHQNKVLEISFWTTNQCRLLCLPASIILSRVQAAKAGQNTGVFGWEDWGVSGTHLYEPLYFPSLTWARRVYGQKAIICGAAATDSLDEYRTSYLANFNPLSLWHYKMTAESDNGALTTAGHQFIATHNVDTPLLPCLLQSMQIPQHQHEWAPDHHDIMITEDAIVVVLPQEKFIILSF